MATGTTLNYSLPYPKSTDPVNVASDIQDLATSLDTDLPEIIQDLSSSMITGGTNYGISTSYNDTTGILSIGVIDDGHSHIAGNIDDLQASLDLKSNIDSPVFTGNPTAPTPSLGDNDSSLATTSFVTSAIDAIESSAVYYQDDAPLSPEVGSVWVDSDEVFSSFSSNDFILKSGGVFTGNIEGTTANFTGNLEGTTANLAGYITVGSTTQSTTTGVNVIVGNASHIGVVVKSQVSQTANIQEWQNNAGTALSYVSSDGRVFSNQSESVNLVSVQTMTNKTITSPEINGGTVNLATTITLSGNQELTSRVRNATLSTIDPSGGSDGDVWIKYV